MSVSSYLRRRRLLRNGLCVMAGILCLIGILFFLCPVVSLGPSMLPTLQEVQILAGTPAFLNPNVPIHRGKVVVLQTDCPFKRIVKRMIALPGDTLQITDNTVYVNGQALDEPYLYEDMRTRDIAPMTLGEDQYFVLGDNRNISADSRYFGLFSRSDILLTADPEQSVLLPVLCLMLIGGMFVFWTVLPMWKKLPEEEVPGNHFEEE